MPWVHKSSIHRTLALSLMFALILVEAWTSPAAISAFLSTALISLVPNLLLLFFPSLFRGAHEKGGGGEGRHAWWQWGQCLAAGGLLGDVFLHTLPHTMEGGHGHSHHHNNSKETFPMGLWIMAGFVVFFTMDIVLRMAQEMVQGNDGHSHDHSHLNTTTTTATCNGIDKNKPDNKKKEWSLIILNLTADALHNFTDGLAIGASYAAAAASSSATTATAVVVVNPGSIATLSILLHEVPHELGDYCTLVAAGYTPWQAVRTQFGTAIAAFIGTAVALLVSRITTAGDAVRGNHDGDALMLCTAGGFLYLAATTLLPHVLQESVAKPWHRLGHLVAFCIGVAFMVGVAVLEEAEHHHRDHGTEEAHGHYEHHDHHHLYDEHAEL